MDAFQGNAGMWNALLRLAPRWRGTWLPLDQLLMTHSGRKGKKSVFKVYIYLSYSSFVSCIPRHA